MLKLGVDNKVAVRLSDSLNRIIGANDPFATVDIKKGNLVDSKIYGDCLADTLSFG